MITGVNHVQISVAAADLDRAREFYFGFLGLREIARPTVFRSKGFWLNTGSFEIHVGEEEGVDRRSTRSHIAYQVSDLPHWRKKVSDAGYQIVEQPKIPNYERFHFRDPFGNNIELIQRT